MAGELIGSSRWQREYEALPQWARELVDALKSSVAYGVGIGQKSLGGFETQINFKESEQASALMEAISQARELAAALTAPWPPPPAPSRERRVFNIVELAAGAEGEDDCAFDQPCCFGHRVETHAVYCHNEAWPDSPRKCRRNRDDYRHEDCPGFVTNPDFQNEKTPMTEHEILRQAFEVLDTNSDRVVHRKDVMGPEPSKAEVEAAARSLCLSAGHDPDGIGDPPKDEGFPRLDHAFPRWMLWRSQARDALQAVAAVREEAT